MGKRVLIAAPINEQEKIFKEYLNSLNSLNIPSDYIVDKFFILSKNSNLSSFLKPNEYIYEDNNFPVNEKHNWNKEKLLNIAELRTLILEKARKEKYDYLFTVDSDIILHPNTLNHLLQLNLPIVTELVWTKIFSNITALDGKYEGEQFFRDKDYTIPGLYEINWGGMITLINSSIFNIDTINYYPIKEVMEEYNENWSFFCKIYCHFPNLKLYMDTTYPGTHLYNEFYYNKWKKENE